MSETYSFIDIYKNKLDLNKETQVKVEQIIIPKIQRPYAQGRQDGVCTYVRNTLLSEMFDNFQTDDIFDFNFVYGIVRLANDTYVMELLDGQQRMTTLFLLHWYIANRELQEGDEMDAEIRDALSRFVYETRSTSTVFCNKMAAYRKDLSGTKPSAAIRNAKWYFKSFDRDSTICAMLTMLDAIHEKYEKQECHELHKKLNNIRFYIKSLGLFNLSEELYIKMNARGLQLSQFENFKADLTSFISDKDYAPYKALVPLYKKDSTDEVEFHFNFSVKLDAKWVDLFWKRGDENFDASYMSFFSRYFACKYIVSTKDVVSDRDMRQDKMLNRIYTDAESRIDANEYLGFQVFKQILDEHPEYILCLDKVLDVFYEHDFKDNKKLLYKSLMPTWEKTSAEDGDDFYDNINTKMTHIKLIALSAVIEFVDAYDVFDEEVFLQWMRVVWNIIENTNIDSLTPVSSLVRKLSAVIHFVAVNSTEGKNFYEALAMWMEERGDERENRALIEEVTKARLIAEGSDWLTTLVAAENHKYFKGMVLFFYTEGMSRKQYQDRLELVSQMFDENGISESFRAKHLLIRAIVSCFNSWNDLRERYITERAETNKYLKNILAAHDGVRNMLAEVLDANTIDEVKEKLEDVINNISEFTAWQGANEKDIAYCNMAVNRLCKDVNLYNWIAEEEKQRRHVFRVYWYEGHITFAVPRKQYARIALDTERGKIAKKICDNYGFMFDDQNQNGMFNMFGDCYGNDVWLYQKRQKCTVWIGFNNYHQLRIQINTKTKAYAKELWEVWPELKNIDKDEYWVEFEKLEHFKCQKTYNQLSKKIEEIFDVIPELESVSTLL